jgi:hypothetical protein
VSLFGIQSTGLVHHLASRLIPIVPIDGLVVFKKSFKQLFMFVFVLVFARCQSDE